MATLVQCVQSGRLVLDSWWKQSFRQAPGIIFQPQVGVNIHLFNLICH